MVCLCRYMDLMKFRINKFKFVMKIFDGKMVASIEKEALGSTQLLKAQFN